VNWIHLAHDKDQYVYVGLKMVSFLAGNLRTEDYYCLNKGFAAVMVALM
jgi:hypothetical protein